MKTKTKKIIAIIVSYLAVATESTALKLGKTSEISNDLGMTGNVVTDGTNFIDKGLTYGGWGFIIAGVVIAGIGVAKAVMNAQADKPTTWELGKSLIYGSVLLIIMVFIGSVMLSFV